jgi:hypothetical protein
MGKSVLARVHWVPPEEDGQTSLPTGKKHSTIARFPEDTGTWLQEAWSIGLEFDEPPAAQRSAMADNHHCWSRSSPSLDTAEGGSAPAALSGRGRPVRLREPLHG